MASWLPLKSNPLSQQYTTMHILYLLVSISPVGEIWHWKLTNKCEYVLIIIMILYLNSRHCSLYLWHLVRWDHCIHYVITNIYLGIQHYKENIPTVMPFVIYPHYWLIIWNNEDQLIFYSHACCILFKKNLKQNPASWTWTKKHWIYRFLI